MKAGTSEKVAMQISGHKTRTVFDRYHIVDSADVTKAMHNVEKLPVENLVPLSAKLVQNAPVRRPRKQLTA
jgi:hypothetical protein